MKIPALAILLAASFVCLARAEDSPEAVAILANDRAYEEAHAKGDAGALAGFFCEDAEYTSDSGESFRGREAIGNAIKAGLANNKGSKLAIQSDAVEPLSPDVLVEKGDTAVTTATGETSRALFTAVLVKKDGKWKIRHLVETPMPALTAGGQLQELAWLVGRWEEKDAAAGVSVDSTYGWARDGNFLTRNISVKRDKETVKEGWQIIGWDPEAQGIRSWTFDSDGGFAEARWTRDGERWLLRESGTTPEGNHFTSDQTITRLGEDSATWESNNRTMDGEPLPAISRITLQRVKAN